MGTRRNPPTRYMSAARRHEIRALEERVARLTLESREMSSYLDRLKQETLAIAAGNEDLRLGLETSQKKRRLLERQMAETLKDFAAEQQNNSRQFPPTARDTAARDTNGGNAADSVKQEEHFEGSN